MTPETIVLAGVAMSALFTGGTALIQYFAEDTQVAAVVFWTFGDLGRVTYRELPIIAVVTAASAVYFMFKLNAGPVCDRRSTKERDAADHGRP